MFHRRHLGRYFGWLGILLALGACDAGPSTSTSLPPTVSTFATTSSVAPTTVPATVTSSTDTPPPPSTTTTTTTTVPPEVALVVGDFGTGSPAEEEVAAAMEAAATEEDAEWFITTGDNFYSNDVQEVWSDPFGWVSERGIEVVAALGNHDVETSARRELVTDRLDIDRDWYRTDAGEAVVLVLSGNRVGDDDQMEWLRNALQESVEELVIAVFHQPAFSCSEHGSTRAVVERWVPLFEDHDVDLVLNGHDHNYQRHVRAGVTYVVTGGGGAGLYPIEPCPEGTDPPVASDDTAHHFLVMSIGPKAVEVEARSVDGEMLDRFSIVP